MKGYDEDDENRPLVLSYKRGKPVWGSPAAQLERYYWGSHQAFFKTLCMSLKLEAVVRIAKEALADGKVPHNISSPTISKHSYQCTPSTNAYLTYLHIYVLDHIKPHHINIPISKHSYQCTPS